MKRIPSVLLGLILFAVSWIIFLSLVSYTPKDLDFLSFPPNKIFHNLVGIVGAYLGLFLIFMFGYGSFFIPIYLFLLGMDRLGLIRLYGFAKGRLIKIVSFLLLFSFICSLIGIFFSEKELIYLYSGFVGSFLSVFLRKYLGLWGALIFLSIVTIVLLWMLAGFFFLNIFQGLRGLFLKLLVRIRRFFKRVGKDRASVTLKPSLGNRYPRRVKEAKPDIKVYTPKPAISADFKAEGISKKEFQKSHSEEKQSALKADAGKVFDPASFRLPSSEILKVPPLLDARQIKEDIEASIKTLEETLADFDVGARVVSVQKGPVVTMYELQPFSGVKIHRITILADDIALAMKSSSVRIVAPIPGRGTVGIEIPNTKKHLVYLREVLEEKVFKNLDSKLALAVGKDVAGNPVVANLKEMPHLLIAGTTGSGKTVCVNSIISSILFKAKPNQVKFILIDPKKVELAPFSGIPHLLHPIISEAKKTFAALNWAVEEMESRYKLLADEGVRNIDVFNEKEFRLPYILIIVDELADLMVVAKDKIETAIQRLAQLSRAVGIHLILATQRPSVDVVTGVIKANFPARISFKVSSKVDARTVLDMMGAEKLLGRGDLLFIRPGFTKPIRAQGSFIDDEDIENLTSFLRVQGRPVYEEGILEAQKQMEVRLERDELLNEAIRVVLATRQASASLLQRRLRVGYTRAARLLDLMEEQGIIGPFCGSKAREILVDPSSFLKEKELI